MMPSSRLKTSQTFLLRNDQKRANYVGEKVIKDMYNKFIKKDISRGKPLNPSDPDPELARAVIFDMDGTLACIGDRSPYDGKSCAVDLPNQSIIALNKMIPPDIRIIILSGRSDDSEKETLAWIDEHNVNYDELHMRKAGDQRKDAVIKEEMFNAYIKGKYNVIFAVDDRNQVVELWRSLGLTCLQVAPGDF
jgi:hypothetical protein